MFAIPNRADAHDALQAEWDGADVAALVAGIGRSGVVSGCAVSHSAGLTFSVAAGSVLVDGALAAVAGGSITLGAADPIYPRFDLVVANSAGAVSAVAGVPVSAPVFPQVPASSVALAAVLVPAGEAASQANRIVDKRVSAAAPYLVGGGANNSTLTLKATSAVGQPGADVIVLAGSGLEAMRIKDNTDVTMREHLDIGGNLTLTNAGSSIIIGSARMMVAFPNGTTSIFMAAAGNLTLSGVLNLGVGSAALANLTSGQQNVGIGPSALQSLQSGNVSVGVGSAALQNTTIGTQNIGIGALAGQGNVSGSNNVFIGYGAGWTGSKSSCVMIGFRCGWFETGSNVLMVDGLGPRASEADARVKALLYGIFASTVAGQSLTVNGSLAVAGTLTLPAAGPHLVGTQGSVEGALKLLTLDASKRWTLHASSITSEAQRDDVIYLGWNVTGAGTKEVAGEPTLFWGMEANYKTGGVNYMEINHDYSSADGLTVKRFQAFNVRRDTHVATWAYSMNGGSFRIEKNVNDQNFVFTPSGSRICVFRNAGGSGELLQIGFDGGASSPDQIQIGPTAEVTPELRIARASDVAADNLAVLIYGNYGTAGAKQLSVGAADSAGAGFRQVRVPN